MKRVVPFFLATVLSLISVTVYAQQGKTYKNSNQRPTNLRKGKPLPPPASIEDIIEAIEAKLQFMQNNPTQYASEDIQKIQDKLEIYCQKRDNPVSPSNTGETPGKKAEWIEITAEEKTRLPEGTKTKVKSAVNVQTGEKTRKVYKKNPEN